MQRTDGKSVYGVGINDAPFTTNPRGPNGKRTHHPVYRKWHDMLRRCYSENYLERFPTYRGCEVVQEWHTFMNFYNWMIQYEYEGLELDKDLLGCGRLYAPHTCCFIPPWLNVLLRPSSIEPEQAAFLNGRLCLKGVPESKVQPILKAVRKAYVYARLDEFPVSARMSLAIDELLA